MNKTIRAERGFISNQPYFSGLRKEVNWLYVVERLALVCLRKQKGFTPRTQCSQELGEHDDN